MEFILWYKNYQMQTHKKINPSYYRYVKAINYCISCGYYIDWDEFDSTIRVSRGRDYPYSYPYHTIHLKPRRYKSQELLIKLINEVGIPKYLNNGN